MVSQSDLLTFARSLPEGLPFTPILRGKQPDHSYEPHPGKAHKGIADLDLAIRGGSTFTGIGLWCGPHSRLVILDVDTNLVMTLEEFGDDLAKAPCITSPRKGAGKYPFRIPAGEDLDKLHGVSLTASGRGFEILWGPARQGVVFGDYPANDHAPDGGSYSLSGSLDNIPPAPEWMLALMRRAKEDDATSTGVLNLKYGGIRRPLEHTRKVITGCLSVLSADMEYGAWIQVGMAIHSALPGEEGLRFWRDWSKLSTLHATAWETEDLCTPKWDTFRRGKTSIASLIWMADQLDKRRERFDAETRDKLAEDEQAEKDTFADLMVKIEAVYAMPNPAEADYELEKIRQQFVRADKGFLDSLYITNMMHNRQPPLQTMQVFMEQDFILDYIIPDVLYAPSIVLIHAAPGEGKTQAALAISKTIVRSEPISIRGRRMPVAGGRVLIAQNDQNSLILQEMFVQHGFTPEDDVYVRNGFNLRDRAGVLETLTQLKPRFVVIDSLSACSVGSPHSENAKEFADPLYFLAKANGTLFPACCIFVVHHSNKNGGHRGTSAITAAVDEVIKLRLPDENEVALGGPDMRVLNFEKSRSGRGGTHLNMVMNSDLSFTLSDPQRPEEGPRTSRIETIQVKILAALRDAYPHDLTTWEIAEQSHTADGSIRPNLARMLKRGLIARGPDRPMLDAHGRTQKTSSYVAVLSSHITTTDVPPLPLEPEEDDHWTPDE
jgi:hypothetical protein